MPGGILKLLTFILFFIISFVTLPFFAEEKLIVDPLLEKPWIQDAREEEQRSYFRFLSSSHEVGKTELHQDSFGRNFHISPSMRIRYTIDNDYHREFPLLGDADLAIREMEALMREKRDKDALFLGKGIALCQRLHLRKEKKFAPSWAIEANALSNSIQSKYGDNPQEMSVATEPYGCYEGDSKELGDLYIESETFRYIMKMPARLRYEGLFRKNAGRSFQIEKSSVRLVRFVEFLSPVRPENWDDMEEAKILQEAGLKIKSPRKILFSIGSTFDELPSIRSPKDYFRFWDKERGINVKSMFEKSFTRIEEKGDYTSRFKMVDETGVVTYYLMKEYYFYKSPLGFFLSLSFPEEEREKGESYWKTIRSEFQVREY
jgi:hypothetical protein